jgi:hypothetical protein
MTRMTVSAGAEAFVITDLLLFNKGRPFGDCGKMRRSKFGKVGLLRLKDADPLCLFLFLLGDMGLEILPSCF